MYVSGSLKNKTIDFYREDAVYLDYHSFKSNNATVFSNGLVRLDDKSTEKKLETKQENLIKRGIDKTFILATKKDIPSLLISLELAHINMTERNISFALFECLYKLIQMAQSNISLKKDLERFTKFREYVESLNRTSSQRINQTDLDIMITLFLNGRNYEQVSLEQAKFSLFQNSPDSITPYFIEVFNFGTFVAPQRVANLAKALRGYSDATIYIAAIYFALKRDSQADLFLKWCNTSSNLDIKKVIDKAELSSVPTNLLKLVRTLEERHNLPF